MDCIYKDPNAPIEARVKDLLSRMTLQEKIGQITQIERSVATPEAIKNRCIGMAEDEFLLYLTLLSSSSLLAILLHVFNMWKFVIIIAGSVLSGGGSTPFDNANSADWADLSLIWILVEPKGHISAPRP